MFGWVRFLATISFFLGTFVAILVIPLAHSCFDTCPTNARESALGVGIVMTPAVLLDLIAWIILLGKAIKYKFWDEIRLLVFPIVLWVAIFLVLVTSVNGNVLFPRTYSAHDIWIGIFAVLIFAVWLWPVGLFFQSLSRLYDSRHER